MLLYLLYILITLIVIILFIISKDRIKLLDKIGKISIIVGVILLSTWCIIRILLYLFLNNFNIIKILDLVLVKFICNGLVFTIIGILILFISKIMNKRRK